MKRVGGTGRKSAGIVLYRFVDGLLEVMLVHPGGPFWKNKDLGVWSIPKGEFTDEDALDAARREFKEETSFDVPDGPVINLEPVKQNRGKTVIAFAVEGNIDAAAVKSNTFKMEWPPKSGKWMSIPEVDKAAWFTPETAKQKILGGQQPLIDQLLSLLTRQP